ncbi:hypothetical protein L6164_033435 [Bauhinia variegata]|uniref:Uncharacterized protein n=1 Tax=Bauhinia variegata TaxID=167791 RepID=A0ACB9KS78_BAUVA|nr:hypothetical protein L6164_033435 [Bauhinia variegata]
MVRGLPHLPPITMNIPKTLWPEAVNWTIYVLNRSPTVAVKNVTPEEVWFSVKPIVEHFRVFGCAAHVHVPDAKKTKIDNKSFECVLLGFSEDSKGYKLYDPIAKKGDDKNDIDNEHEAEGDLEAASEDNEEAVGDENHAADNVVPNLVDAEGFDPRDRRVR